MSTSGWPISVRADAWPYSNNSTSSVESPSSWESKRKTNQHFSAFYRSKRQIIYFKSGWVSLTFLFFCFSDNKMLRIVEHKSCSSVKCFSACTGLHISDMLPLACWFPLWPAPGWRPAPHCGCAGRPEQWNHPAPRISTLYTQLLYCRQLSYSEHKTNIISHTFHLMMLLQL